MSKRKVDLKNKHTVQPFKDWRYLKVPLLFCFLVTVLIFISLIIANNGYLSFFEIFNTNVANILIHLSGVEARAEGNIIYVTNAVWKIDTECTALTIMIIFTSFVMVYPAVLKAKGMAVLTGIPFIFGANMIRLLIMAWIDKLKPAYSNYFHDYLWQVAFIIMVVLMWIVWIEKVVNRERKATIHH